MELMTVNIKDIEFGERFREEYGDLDSLAASIKKDGQIQPLAVKHKGNGSYILLAGGRRYKACVQAGVEEVGVRVYPESITEMEMRSIELMENVCRKDLSWVEATNLRKEIYELQVSIYGSKVSTSPDAEGVSQADIAKMLGITPAALTQDLQMAKALSAFPQLKEGKNKHEATKMLKKLTEEVAMAELAKRVRNKQADTPIERIQTMLINNYIVGDFFNMIKKIPDNSIDVVEIDPPYGIDLKAIKKTDSSINMGTLNYNEVPMEEYIPFITKLFKECYRVMSSNSWIICWFAQEPWFEVVYQALTRQGFEGSRNAGIWYKENSSSQVMHPESALASSYECFFYMRKGAPSITRQGRNNVFAYKSVNTSYKIHPTERPIELIQELLQTFCWEGARVLVPFLGSGNTLLAASNLGMTAFGYDLSQEYKNSYTVRVTEGRPGTYRSYKEA